MIEKYNKEVCELFKQAEKERALLNHEFVGTEHLLLAILKNNSVLEKSVQKYHLSYDGLLKEIQKTLPQTNKKVINNIYTPLLKNIIKKTFDKGKIDDIDLLINILGEGEGVGIRLLMGMDVDVDLLYNYLINCDKGNNLEIYKHGKLLNNYINLNEKVIGREKEIQLLIETLLRKKKNNPLLVGDAGVGKSAIVEELARRIVKGMVPEELKNAQIVMLEMGSLIAGTRYRGEFEDRLSTIIDEIIKNPQIILFIDEIHTMVNAGAAEGAIAAADILKPYLARGDIKCIGATTKSEYESFFLKDKALSRRFELILVNEPDEEETFDILSKVKGEYTEYHNVAISDEVLKNLIHLANVYFPNKRNPDKSLELLDSVFSFVKIRNNDLILNKEQEELKKLNLCKIKAIENGDYKQALNLNMMENKIKKKVNNLKRSKIIYVKNDDIIDELEHKNNIIINSHKIKQISKLKENYDDVIINLITKTLLKSNHAKTFIFNGNSGNLVKDLAKIINFQVINIKDSSNIENIYNKVKYYPSSILVFNNDNEFTCKNLINQISRDNLIEHQGEYINFSNCIMIIKKSLNTIGFNQKYISDYPVDQIIDFNDLVIS